MAEHCFAKYYTAGDPYKTNLFFNLLFNCFIQQADYIRTAYFKIDLRNQGLCIQGLRDASI